MGIKGRSSLVHCQVDVYGVGDKWRMAPRSAKGLLLEECDRDTPGSRLKGILTDPFTVTK